MKAATWDAVIFDYGGVLCYAPTREDVAAYAQGSGIDGADFLHLYSQTRDYYGRAAAGYEAEWHCVASAAGVPITETAVKQFIAQESGLWTRPNEETLALARAVKAAGNKIAILSNMTFDLLAVLRGKFDWLDEFDVRIWSCEHGCAKPDDSIYASCLTSLGCQPGRALFFDDRPPNVEAAKKFGIEAHVFESAAQAREVVQRGMELPE
ncbi:MAG TPA: HAD family phosphatase [Candidatus Angelobacter sp.]|jgi:putative hydrolase of the HAD superfamily|nr:HAD family phosphatase [Candidatus Angelobacter sp.]